MTNNVFKNGISLKTAIFHNNLDLYIFKEIGIMKKAQILFLFLLFFLTPASALLAETYYVNNTTGNDAYPGTLSMPLKTISRVNSLLKAGDTAIIRQGTYKESIRPSSNGSSGKYITYTNYEQEKVVLTNVTYAINLSSKSYIKVDGIDVDGQQIGDSSNVTSWVNLDGGSYNIVMNGNFKRAYGWAGIRMKAGANHNKILDNTMQYCGSYARDNGDMIQIETGNYNLIEGNTASYAGHNILSLDGHKNVIRNNNFSNPWERVVEVRKYKGNGSWNLIEGNRFHGASPATDNPIPPCMKLLGEYQIVRNNLLYDNVSYAFQISPKSDMPNANHHKIYNNVVFNNGGEAIKLWHNSSNAVTTGIQYANNIFFKNGGNQEIHLNISGLDDNKFRKNNIFRSDPNQYVINTKSYGLNDVQWYNNNQKNYFSSNIETQPDFLNESERNFQLKSTSAMVDKGTFLTFITSNDGMGNSFRVSDSSFFSDGWGIVEPDSIQLEGQSTALTIVSIDYTSNIITVDRSVSWHNGQGVALPYKGTAPDIGAYEVGNESSTTTTLLPPKNLKVVFIN